ncbi:MAG: molybdate ABC transporter permease subunit [Pseudomonadota bacterium]
MNEDLAALWLTFKLAAVTTLILVVVGTPAAWWLGRTRSRWRVLVEPLIALPIVLPPTVMGFYLLIAFAPTGPLGQAFESLTGRQLAFTFEALVIGSVFYSLPFYVQPLQVAFEGLSEQLLESARTMGAGPFDRFFSVVVPVCRRGFIIGSCLAFAHTVGEFGIVLMIGGSIPGETRVLSIALFEQVETLNYTRAHILAAGLLLFSFLLLCMVYTLNRRYQTLVSPGSDR